MALRKKIRSLRSPSNSRSHAIVYCCRAAQKEENPPHIWYSHSGTIFKCHYCKLHKHEVNVGDTFKTKNQLLAYLATKKLLNESIDDIPF
jgi:hypothetical protein